jgi:hypothetical protein
MSSNCLSVGCGLLSHLLIMQIFDSGSHGPMCPTWHVKGIPPALHVCFKFGLPVMYATVMPEIGIRGLFSTLAFEEEEPVRSASLVLGALERKLSDGNSTV